MVLSQAPEEVPKPSHGTSDASGDNSDAPEDDLEASVEVLDGFDFGLDASRMARACKGALDGVRGRFGCV